LAEADERSMRLGSRRFPDFRLEFALSFALPPVNPEDSGRGHDGHGKVDARHAGDLASGEHSEDGREGMNFNPAA